jgi:ABC-type lipopolysaccharide export system ATPase subunit
VTAPQAEPRQEQRQEQRQEHRQVIVSIGEAEQAIANLAKIMDRLAETIEQETAQTRAGHMLQAGALEAEKAELARAYSAESARLAGGREFVARVMPGAVAALRERHGAFQELLQTNLTVLATAHAVSEGIIRGVAGELARTRAPQTYGATGRANAPGAKASQPMAVSRRL